MKRVFLISISIIFLFACKKKKDDTTIEEDFNREEMLESISSHYILPSYTEYLNDLNAFGVYVDSFAINPNLDVLDSVINKWEKAYFSWQRVGFMDFGPANNELLVQNMNIYPVDTTKIINNISLGSYNLSSASNIDAKGFPAIDYLLNSESKNMTISSFLNSNKMNYLIALKEDMLDYSTRVLQTWESDYSSEFIQNNGSAVGSSIGLMTNGFIQYLEVHLRDGKIGIPSGVRNGFSQLAMPKHVEALYKNDISIELCLEALKSAKNYFKGMDYHTKSNEIGYDDYLKHIGFESLSDDIIRLFDESITMVESLDSPLSDEVQNNQQNVINAFNKMQQLITLLKVDMTSALSISITYADNDGD